MGETWSGPASEDLITRVSYQVALELIEVAKTSLDYHYPPDGDEAPPYLVRRGIRHNARTWAPLTSAQIEAREYVLVYKRRGILRHDYLILAIYKNSDLANVLADYLGQG